MDRKRCKYYMERYCEAVRDGRFACRTYGEGYCPIVEEERSEEDVTDTGKEEEKETNSGCYNP
jgi:hypothetical protein